MKRVLLILLIVLPNLVWAEGTFGAYKNARQDLYFIELIGGAGIPSFYGGNQISSNVVNYAHVEGVSFRWQNRERYAIAGQLSYAGSKYLLGLMNDWELYTNNITLYIPAEIEFRLSKIKRQVSSRLLFYTGPYVVNFLEKNIETNTGVQAVVLKGANRWDFGIESGIGMRLPIFRLHTLSNLTLKASYFRGFSNMFPTNGNESSVLSLKSTEVNKLGALKNQGIKFTICYDMSLRKWKMTTFTAKGDGKVIYDRFVVYNQ